MMSEAIRSAIQANDYDAFTKAWNEQQSTIKAPTQEQFSHQVKMFNAHQTVEAAVLANDYEAFKKAIAAMPKPLDRYGKEITDAKERPTPTAEEFAKMVEGKKKQQAIETTLKANDYNAFVTTWTANKPTLPTKEEFTKIVENKDTHQGKGGMMKGKKGGK